MGLVNVPMFHITLLTWGYFISNRYVLTGDVMFKILNYRDINPKPQALFKMGAIDIRGRSATFRGIRGAPEVKLPQSNSFLVNLMWIYPTVTVLALPHSKYMVIFGFTFMISEEKNENFRNEKGMTPIFIIDISLEDA